MPSMFQIVCWYNKGHDDKNKMENIAKVVVIMGKIWFIYEKYEYQLQRYNQLFCVEYSVTICWYVMDY